MWDAGVEHVEEAEEDGYAHAREEDLRSVCKLVYFLGYFGGMRDIYI